MKKIDKLILVLACLSIFLFVISKSFASLESKVDARSTMYVGKWNILVNNQNLNSVYSDDITLDDISWESNSHVSDGMAAPGRRGVISFEVDPTDTDVAVKYTITFRDHNDDPSYLLTIRGISTDGTPLVRSGEYSYTGIFSLQDIRNSNTKTVSIDVEWVNDESNNESDSLIGSQSAEARFLYINMEAVQYNGESIEQYSGD